MATLDSRKLEVRKLLLKAWSCPYLLRLSSIKVVQNITNRRSSQAWSLYDRWRSQSWWRDSCCSPAWGTRGKMPQFLWTWADKWRYTLSSRILSLGSRLNHKLFTLFLLDDLLEKTEMAVEVLPVLYHLYAFPRVFVQDHVLLVVAADPSDVQLRRVMLLRNEDDPARRN